jgi:hypothetical protein
LESKTTTYSIIDVICSIENKKNIVYFLVSLKLKYNICDHFMILKKISNMVVPLENNYYNISKAIGGLVTIGETESSSTEENNISAGEGKEEIPVTESGTVADVEAAQNGSYVELTWDALAVDGQEVTQYRVQRYVQDESGNWVKDGYAPSVTGTSYVDKRAKVGVPYQYKIIPRVGYYDESKAGSVEITLS